MPKLRRDGLVWEALDDEIVALDLRSSQYLRLNRTGAYLWRGLEEAVTETELARRLVDVFRVPPQVAHVDVTAFLTTLDEAGLLEAT